MEKKGDLLKQFAIITDLLEKVNMDYDSTTIVIGLSEKEFIRVFEFLNKKQNTKQNEKPNDTFKITIGLIDIIFNKNSV